MQRRVPGYRDRMAHKSFDVYLNDHLSGATLGSNLAGQIAEDRATLERLMDQLGVSRNPVKQATGWLAEAASRIKFSGLASGQPDHGVFMALETLALGVRGKWSLWRALREVRDDYPELRELDLAELLVRAERQYETLERERLAAGRAALAAAATTNA